MKYIDAEKLKEKICAENTVSFAHGSLTEFDQGCHYAFLKVLSFIDSLPQEQPEVFDTIAFQKGVQEGRRLAIETIQSRIGEILGDAQPAPILRIELNELIKKIEA